MQAKLVRLQFSDSGKDSFVVFLHILETLKIFLPIFGSTMTSISKFTGHFWEGLFWEACERVFNFFIYQGLHDSQRMIGLLHCIAVYLKKH